ncbi:MAG: DUF4160 domain-containing protein [Actinomycetota bacterium]
MPRICEFSGIVITMHWLDHPPPHFHAAYGGASATVRIDDGSILGGALPLSAQRVVTAWATARRADLTANRDRAMRHEPIAPVAPLR